MCCQAASTRSMVQSTTSALQAASGVPRVRWVRAGSTDPTILQPICSSTARPEHLSRPVGSKTGIPGTTSILPLTLPSRAASTRSTASPTTSDRKTAPGGPRGRWASHGCAATTARTSSSTAPRARWSRTAYTRSTAPSTTSAARGTPGGPRGPWAGAGSTEPANPHAPTSSTAPRARCQQAPGR